MLNLSVICPDRAVKVLYVETTEEFLSQYGSAEVDASSPYAFNEDEEEGCELCFNMELVRTLYKQSWLHHYVSCDVLVEGFIIKQLAKYRYTVQRETFDEVFQAHIIKSKTSPLYGLIYDLLFSFMAEYNLCFDFPELSQRLELLNSAVTYSYASKLQRLGVDYAKTYGPYVLALEQLLRYNAVKPGVELGFLNYCLPLCLVAKRTNYRNAIEAALLIEEWLVEATPVLLEPQGQELKPKQEEQSKDYYEKDIRAVTDQELEEISHNARLLSVKAKLQDIAVEIGFQAGTGRAPRHTNETNLFFLDTIRKYNKEIAELEYMFKRVFTSMKILDSFDGDVNLHKQQAAYIASMTMEEAKVYQYYQKRKVSVDIVILRDVSGSTYTYEKEYAEAIIEILAAVNGFQGVRTMEIDFGGEVLVNKTFEQSIDMASIFPTAGGGTTILPAIALLKNQTFKGRRRLLFILSDGEINDRAQADYELEEFCRDNGVEMVKIALGELCGHGYEYTPVKLLHKVIAKKILEREVADDE